MCSFIHSDYMSEYIYLSSRNDRKHLHVISNDLKQQDLNMIYKITKFITGLRSKYLKIFYSHTINEHLKQRNRYNSHNIEAKTREYLTLCCFRMTSSA